MQFARFLTCATDQVARPSIPSSVRHLSHTWTVQSNDKKGTISRFAAEDVWVPAEPWEPSCCPQHPVLCPHVLSTSSRGAVGFAVPGALHSHGLLVVCPCGCSITSIGWCISHPPHISGCNQAAHCRGQTPHPAHTQPAVCSIEAQSCTSRQT